MYFFYNMVPSCEEESLRNNSGGDTLSDMIECEKKKYAQVDQFDFTREFVNTKTYNDSMLDLAFKAQPLQMEICKLEFEREIYSETNVALGELEQCMSNYGRPTKTGGNPWVPRANDIVRGLI